MRQVKVSACIVTWNGEHLLARLLESLEAVQWADLHIVVVDNASADDTAVMVKQRFPCVEFVRLENNIGYSAAINVGIERAASKSAELVWVFNNDVVVEPDTLERLVDAIESDERIGVAGPLVMDYSTRKVVHAGYRISLFTGRMSKIGSLPDEKKPYEVDSAFGCSNLIRMAVSNQIGGFDPAYNVYFDETDFNTRARHAGWKVVVVPSARVYHEESATMDRFVAHKAWLLLRNLVRFEIKNARLGQLAVFFPYFLLIHLPLFLIRGLWYVIKLRREARDI